MSESHCDGIVLKCIIGNWKMNMNVEESVALAKQIRPSCEHSCVRICPNFLALDAVKKALPDGIMLGGQDCHAEVSGAHTGDTSAEMLRDVGCKMVIVGHSERRQDHGETSTQVGEKAEAALAAGLEVFVCVGEPLDIRERGAHIDYVLKQLEASMPQDKGDGIVGVAYEPIWAIGTGKVPSTEDIAEMHGEIRTWLLERYGDGAEKIEILYGGSVKPDNAQEIMNILNVDGVLVGGASLKADSFNAIIEAASA